MRHAPRAFLAAGLGFAVSFLVACGGGHGLLASDQAGTLQNALDQAGSAVSAGNCTRAVKAVDAFSNAVAGLPATVNHTLVTSLSNSADTLRVQVARDCAKSAQSTTPTTASTSSDTTPTTDTATSPPTTTSTTPPPPTTTTPRPAPPETTTSTPGTSGTGGSGGAGLGGGGTGGGGSGSGGAGSTGGAASAGGNGQ